MPGIRKIPHWHSVTYGSSLTTWTATGPAAPNVDAERLTFAGRSIAAGSAGRLTERGVCSAHEGEPAPPTDTGTSSEAPPSDGVAASVTVTTAQKAPANPYAWVQLGTVALR